MDIELVTEGLEFPEGPIAMADGSVILTEIRASALTRVTPDGKKETVAQTGGGAQRRGDRPGRRDLCHQQRRLVRVAQARAASPSPARRRRTHTGGSIQRVDIKTGKVETVYDACEGRRLIGPNDLVFDKQGGFWFTDHGCAHAGGAQVRRALLRQARRLEDHARSATTSSRPTASASRRTRRSSTSPTPTLAGSGPSISASPASSPQAGFAPGRVVCNLQGYQLLDSLAVEAGGKVCVATIINGGITAFDPRRLDRALRRSPTSSPPTSASAAPT